MGFPTTTATAATRSAESTTWQRSEREPIRSTSQTEPVYETTECTRAEGRSETITESESGKLSDCWCGSTQQGGHADTTGWSYDCTGEVEAEVERRCKSTVTIGSSDG
jgi:hypothetical protein